jgi:hypothetical protein
MIFPPLICFPISDEFLSPSILLTLAKEVSEPQVPALLNSMQCHMFRNVHLGRCWKELAMTDYLVQEFGSFLPQNRFKALRLSLLLSLVNGSHDERNEVFETGLGPRPLLARGQSPPLDNEPESASTEEKTNPFVHILLHSSTLCLSVLLPANPNNYCLLLQQVPLSF